MASSTSLLAMAGVLVLQPLPTLRCWVVGCLRLVLSLMLEHYCQCQLEMEKHWLSTQASNDLICGFPDALWNFGALQAVFGPFCHD